MAAEPIPAPVAFLDSRDEALTEMALALDTERSANKAMLQAVKGLDAMLDEQRARVEALEGQLTEYATAVTEQAAVNKDQLEENKRLWCQVRLAEHRLTEELEKPLWRRVLRK